MHSLQIAVTMLLWSEMLRNIQLYYEWIPSTRDIIGSNIIRAAEIIRVEKLIPNAVL